VTSRMRVYDAEDLAVGMTETFKNRPWEYRDDLPFTWPRSLHNVGDSLSLAYASDKWSKNPSSERDWELYKHLAESRNRVLIKKGLLKDYHSPGVSWPVRGPMVSLEGLPLPKHFSILCLFEEIDLQLYMAGTSRRPRFGRKKDDGIVQVKVRHGIIGGSKILWSVDDPSVDDQLFLFVYTDTQGVLIMVVGEELDVLKDGIVG